MAFSGQVEYKDICTVAPSDTVDFKNDATNNQRQHDIFLAYVTVTGNISFADLNGVTRTLTAVPAFTLIPIPMRRVNLTNTTATVLALIPA